MEGVTNKEEEIFSIVEPDLSTLGTITLSRLKILNGTIFGVATGTEEPTFNFPHSKG
jgi:hypothetical protein